MTRPVRRTRRSLLARYEVPNTPNEAAQHMAIAVARLALTPLAEGRQQHDWCRDGPQQGGRGRKDEREAGRRYAYLDSTRYSLNNHSLYKQPTPSALPTRLLRSKSLTHDTRYCELSTIIRLEEHTEAGSPSEGRLDWELAGDLHRSSWPFMLRLREFCAGQFSVAFGGCLMR